MKQTIKKVLFAVAPQWMTAKMSARSRAHSQRMIAQWGCGPLNRRLLEKFGSVVVQGPFAGMTMSPMTQAEQLGPYLLGVYESELDPAWDAVFANDYPQIIDIGAKFGYYVVGLARRYPNAQIVAFDTDPWARDATREMADANGIATERFKVLGYCEPSWLADNVVEGAFIISDCEGFEGALFSKAIVQKLASCTFIIEVHDEFNPRVSDRLRNAFADTHTLREYGGEQPRRSIPLDLSFLNPSETNLATHEVRGPQLWFLCLPQSRARS